MGGTTIFYRFCKRISGQYDYTRGKRIPRGEEVQESVAAASAHLCTQKLPHPLTVNEFMPIRDRDERQYSIIPANESHASLFALVVSGSRLRLSAIVDVHEDEKE
ncbi:hypothetical protein J6590_082120 [Homalodisca vitripennis]|nr:hypothetical protein J6590_082120 [Homalodisca vitripennis]